MIGYYLRHGLKRIYRSQQFAFFAWDANEMGPGADDPEIRELEVGPDFNQVGPRVLPPFLWEDGRSIMMNRLRRGMARLYILEIDGVTAGYCFTQNWSIFKRSLGWIDSSGVMLGPGWTDPAFRGKRIHGRLMKHAIYAEAERGFPKIYGMALVKNLAARRGIERTGPIFLGCHEIREYFFGLVNVHKSLDHLPAHIDHQTKN